MTNGGTYYSNSFEWNKIIHVIMNCDWASTSYNTKVTLMTLMEIIATTTDSDKGDFNKAYD